jgi:hypothetical protein
MTNIIKEVELLIGRCLSVAEVDKVKGLMLRDTGTLTTFNT